MLQENDGQQIVQSGNNPDFDSVQNNSSMHEIDKIYLSHSDPLSDPGFQPELAANLDSRRLYAIANKIKAAREYRLDTQFFTHEDRQNNFIGSVAKVLFGRDLALKRTEPLTEDILRAQESAIGSTIFGSMAPNEQMREFFYDKRIADRDSWFFHQVVAGAQGVTFEVTLHYEVHPNGILRLSSDPNVKNEFIHGKELEDFKTSTSMYYDMVIGQLYANSAQTHGRLAA